MNAESHGGALAVTLIADAVAPADELADLLGRKPTLAIVAGADDDARRFVDIKRKALQDLAIEISPVWLDDGGTTEDCVAEIERLNKADHVDAIFLQFPLPEGIDSHACANALALTKDIDCSSDRAEAEFLAGSSIYIPVAPQAATDLLVHMLGSMKEKRILVYGDEDPFNRALNALLVRRGAYLTSSLADADAMVVSGVLPPAETFEEVDAIYVLLDAGYYLPARPPDWIPAHRQSRIGTLLTQYGNVGPLTVAHLAHATITAAKRHFGR